MGEWYGVRCLFRWGARNTYEERITLWRADSAEAAILLAEREAAEYADGQGFEYLHLAQSFKIFDAAIGQGTEVFSLLRDSDLDPDAYLTALFDTGSERQRKLDG
ncbi:hypothetical protein [Streptosporangium longisporum]|uniref:DUF4288 domain-containing protein n=1 Tax=Streptosporangium longisporum TaxID=46187 RepID=A0ABP6KFT6_9ACTN